MGLGTCSDAHIIGLKHIASKRGRGDHSIEIEFGIPHCGPRLYPQRALVEAFCEIDDLEFHGFLRDADHDGIRGGRVGAEWFLTSLKFLDRVARSLGLEVRTINDFAIEDE